MRFDIFCVSIHILAADGCFSDDGFFYVPSINIDADSIEKLFIHRIFQLLLKNILSPKGQ